MINEIELGSLYAKKVKNLNPEKFLDEAFELYSISAFDNGKPEINTGAGIGSSKKVLEPNDVILSRIVPHIRRCWVVPESNNLKQIGSSEWIVFRNNKVLPDFLRYFLLSNPFHSFFMNTVKGVGGSLLRADPKQVARFKIPLPPLKIQQSIAQKLNDSAALLDKTEQLLKEYDLLAQSIFLEMFGDPETNPKGWEKLPFPKLFKQGKVSVKPENISNGQKYIGLEHIEKETGEILEVVDLKENQLKSNKFWFDDSYVLYGKLRPYLNKVATPTFEGVCSTDIIPFKAIPGKSNKAFLFNLLKGKWFVNYANERTSGANLPRISPKEINNYYSINPPIALQNQFAEKITLIEEQKVLAKQELKESKDLFDCLLQMAFKGELK